MRRHLPVKLGFLDTLLELIELEKLLLCLLVKLLKPVLDWLQLNLQVLPELCIGDATFRLIVIGDSERFWCRDMNWLEWLE